MLDVCKKKNKVLAVINLDEVYCNNKIVDIEIRCSILTADNSNSNISCGANFKIKRRKKLTKKKKN